MERTMTQKARGTKEYASDPSDVTTDFSMSRQFIITLREARPGQFFVMIESTSRANAMSSFWLFRTFFVSKLAEAFPGIDGSS
jgi:hypothetical protein